MELNKLQPKPPGPRKRPIIGEKPAALVNDRGEPFSILPKDWNHLHLSHLRIFIKCCIHSSRSPTSSENSPSTILPKLVTAAQGLLNPDTFWNDSATVEDLLLDVEEDAYKIRTNTRKLSAVVIRFVKNVITVLLWEDGCKLFEQTRRPATVAKLVEELAVPYQSRLWHHQFGESAWPSQMTIFHPTRKCPLLAIVNCPLTCNIHCPRLSTYSQDTAYLLSLAQESFRRNREKDGLDYCWPALLSIHEDGVVVLLSLKISRMGMHRREMLVYRDRLLAEDVDVMVHAKWDLKTREGRESYVQDMARWLWEVDHDGLGKDGERVSLIEGSCWDNAPARTKVETLAELGEVTEEPTGKIKLTVRVEPTGKAAMQLEEANLRKPFWSWTPLPLN